MRNGKTRGICRHDSSESCFLESGNRRYRGPHRCCRRVQRRTVSPLMSALSFMGEPLPKSIQGSNNVVCRRLEVFLAIRFCALILDLVSCKGKRDGPERNFNMEREEAHGIGNSEVVQRMPRALVLSAVRTARMFSPITQRSILAASRASKRGKLCSSTWSKDLRAGKLPISILSNTRSANWHSIEAP